MRKSQSAKSRYDWSVAMRILTVSHFFESHGGGIEIVASATARALARRGHECRWAAAALDQPPDDPLIAPVALPASDPLERWAGLPMPIPKGAGREILEREVAAADAVIIHDALYVSSILAARYARRHRKPWIHVQHIGAIPYQSPLLRLAMASANRLVARPLLASAPQTVFISNAVRGFFADVRWKNAPALLLNGVDHKLFGLPTAAQQSRLRQKFRMSDERRQLLFVGRFVEKKGLAIIRAMAAEHPEWDFSLAGGGPIDPGTWGLSNVHPLGRKSRDELAELYLAADALLLPSVGEGFPLVVQEAMACGLPVFCGLDSAAADPRASHLLHALEVNPTDPVGTGRCFAAVIAKTPAAPDRRLAAHARQAYNWDVNARWLEDKLCELLAGSSVIDRPDQMLRPANTPVAAGRQS